MVVGSHHSNLDLHSKAVLKKSEKDLNLEVSPVNKQAFTGPYRHSHGCRGRGCDAPSSAITGCSFETPPLCQALLQTLAGWEGAGPREGWVCVRRTRDSSAFPAPLYSLPPPPAPSLSVAKCLGAKTVAARALACTQELKIFSEVVEDREAVDAVQQFLGE